MPARVRRNGRERRWPVGLNEAVGVVLDDHHAVPPRDSANLRAPALRDRDGCRVLQGRVEVDRLGGVRANALLESLGDDAILVHLDPDQLQTELSGDRTHTGIRDRFAQHRLASLGEQAENADHRRMRAGRYEDTLLSGNECASTQPGRCSVPISRRAAKALVSEQRLEIRGDACISLPHARDESRILRLGRHVHREIRTRTSGPGFAANHRGAADERAAPDDQFDQSPLAGLDVTARDRREVERQALRQFPLRRQAVARGKPAGGDVGRIWPRRSRDTAALPGCRARASTPSSLFLSSLH